LCCGLGGGLDVVNASILYFLAKKDSDSFDKSLLGSTRPASLDDIENHKPFAPHGTILSSTSKIKSSGRYAECYLSKLLNENIYYFTRTASKGKSKAKSKRIKALSDAYSAVIKSESLTHMFFVDGGGDSLILENDDGISTSEDLDPFKGGDAEALEAIYNVKENIPIFLVIISMGLDIHSEKFFKNIQHIKKKNGYYGRINLFDFRKEELRIEEEKILQFNNNKAFLDDYFHLCEDILILKPEHLKKRVQ